MSRSVTRPGARPLAVRLGAGMAALALLAACGTDSGEEEAPEAGDTSADEEPDEEDDHEDDDQDHDDDGHEHEGERDFVEVSTLDHRLVFGYDGGIATLDTSSGEVIDEQEIPGFLRLNGAGDGRHVLVSAGDGWELFDVGLDASLHGDHYHYYEADPHWPDFVFEAETPAHVVTHAGLTALFDDGTGEITLFDPAELGEGDVETDTSYSVPEAHHGVAVPMYDDELVITVGDADGRSGAALLDADREVIAEADNCPGVHGEAVAEDHMVILGCEDGPIILHGDHWHKVEADTGDNDFARTGNLFGTHASPIVLGDLRTDPDEPMTEVVLVDTREDSMQLVEVDAPYNFRGLARGPQGEALVLTESGALHVIDPETGEITDSIDVVAEWTEPEEWQEPRPALTVAGEIAYVTEPATNQIHAVDIAGGEVLATYDLDVMPNEIVAVTGFPVEESADDHGNDDGEHGHEDEDHEHGDEDDHDH